VNIYVGNLSLEATEGELRKEFTEFGKVTSITIMNDNYIGSGQPRGYCYIEMVSQSEGETAIAKLEGKEIRGRVISVVEALPLSNKKRAIPISTRGQGRFKKRERNHNNN
jgi:RNA recognition motif-containing protein